MHRYEYTYERMIGLTTGIMKGMRAEGDCLSFTSNTHGNITAIVGKNDEELEEWISKRWPCWKDLKIKKLPKLSKDVLLLFVLQNQKEEIEIRNSNSFYVDKKAIQKIQGEIEVKWKAIKSQMGI